MLELSVGMFLSTWWFGPDVERSYFNVDNSRTQINILLPVCLLPVTSFTFSLSGNAIGSSRRALKKEMVH